MRDITQINLVENEIKALRGFKQELLTRFPEAEVTLYGSKARGERAVDSDIDLLILVDGPVTREVKEEIVSIAYELELTYDVVFGLLVEDRSFWQSALARAMPLHWNVDREGVLL
jgi:predicted nucleotidyltransferase